MDDVYFSETEYRRSRSDILSTSATVLPGWDVKHAHFLDCAGRYEGPPVTDERHLVARREDRDGTRRRRRGSLRPDRGEREDHPAPFGLSVVTVGLPYPAEIETLQIDTQMKDGTIQGRVKRIPEVILRVKDTRGIAVSPSSDRQDLLVELKPPLTFMDPIAPFTGDTNPIVMSSGFDRNGGGCTYGRITLCP